MPRGWDALGYRMPEMLGTWGCKMPEGMECLRMSGSGKYGVPGEMNYLKEAVDDGALGKSPSHLVLAHQLLQGVKGDLHLHDEVSYITFCNFCSLLQEHQALILYSLSS